MKKWMWIVPFLFAFGVTAQAADKPLKIGVINLQEIVAKTPDVKATEAKLKKKFKVRQDEMIAAQKTLKANATKLQRDGAVMSSKEKNALQDKLVSGKRDLQRMQEDLQQDIELAKNQAMQSFYDKLKVAIEKVAKKGNYDLILQKGSLPFTSPRIDVTAQVIKSLS